MTLPEAAALANLGNRDRRLVSALVRVIAGRATAEDFEALLPREAGESLLRWACRCRGLATGSELSAELSRLDSEAAGQLATARRVQVANMT